MSTTKKIAHNTIVQFVGKIISTFLGLITIGILSRQMGVQYNWYVTVVTFLQFVGIMIDFGMTPVTAQMMSEPHFDKEKLFKNLLGYRLVTAIFFLGLAPLVALAFPYPIEVKIAIGIATLNFLANALNQVLTGFYQTKLKMHIHVIADLTSRLVLLFGVYFYFKFDNAFYPVIWIITISTMVQTLVMWLSALKDTKIGLAFDKNIWKAITKKMWPIAISISFNVLYLKGDLLLLTIYRQNEVGFYGNAYRVLDILAQSAMMLMGIMLPLLAFAWSRNLKEDFNRRYQQSFDAMMLLATPMLTGTLVLAEKIMVLVFGKEYAIAGKPLQILALAVFGISLGAVYGHMAVAIDRQKQTIIVYAVNAILTVIGYLIFIPKYGMLGAAWMTVFSEVFAGILLYLVVKHYTKSQLNMKNFAKIVFSSLVMGCSLFLLNDKNIFLLIFLGIIIYGFFILALGTVSKKTIMEIISAKKYETK